MPRWPWGSHRKHRGHRIVYTFEGHRATIHICWPSHEPSAPSDSIAVSPYVTLHLMTSYLSRVRILAIAMLKSKLRGYTNVNRKEGCCVPSSPRWNMWHGGQQVCTSLAKWLCLFKSESHSFAFTRSRSFFQMTTKLLGYKYSPVWTCLINFKYTYAFSKHILSDISFGLSMWWKTLRSLGGHEQRVWEALP